MREGKLETARRALQVLKIRYEFRGDSDDDDDDDESTGETTRFDGDETGHEGGGNVIQAVKEVWDALVAGEHEGEIQFADGVDVELLFQGIINPSERFKVNSQGLADTLGNIKRRSGFKS